MNFVHIVGKGSLKIKTKSTFLFFTFIEPFPYNKLEFLGVRRLLILAPVEGFDGPAVHTMKIKLHPVAHNYT